MYPLSQMFYAFTYGMFLGDPLLIGFEHDS